MLPNFSVTSNDKVADVYKLGDYYSIEMYDHQTWCQSKIAQTEEAARTLAEQFIGQVQPVLLNESK